MIVYDLECRVGAHKFEGWFGSSDDFSRQQERGLVTCPHCGSADVGKALMAPRVARKGNQLPEPIRGIKPRRMSPENEVPAPAPVVSAPLPPEAMALMHKLANMQAEALKSSRFVGNSFAEDARAMHYGEREAETIHGQATIAEAKELLDEGIAVAPLPFPVVPPEQAN
ncbi:hypothetical protein HNO88_000331 [Novosphingobium chloroacetimidivorans]|uniref:DUF1178 family protein n=1 Tax=Novosphingobium chloroacetimidivorans TaxID=1428314 RepID=A0A7W7K792_9SPHN|nr:DUF1178 family protein [Novosphingobium chloroacetimidivorans]MBB4857034.1 hypothetical protein [Novosphingobium chloroacetimidivorans]